MKKEIRIYGFGGQGIITLGHLIGESAVEDKKEVIMTEEYSPYITGGWSRADIIISDSAIDYPLISGIDFDSDLVDYSNLKKNIIAIKAKKISEELKNPRGMNIVIFGTFVSKTGIVSKESAINAIKKRFPKYVKENLNAFEVGYKGGNL